MRSSRVTDQWATWINANLPRLTLDGDRATWEVVFGMAAGADGQRHVELNVFMFMPGPVLHSMMTKLASIQNPAAATEEGVVTVLRTLVAALHAERSAILSAGAQPNGAGPKLILPS